MPVLPAWLEQRLAAGMTPAEAAVAKTASEVLNLEPPQPKRPEPRTRKESRQMGRKKQEKLLKELLGPNYERHTTTPTKPPMTFDTAVVAMKAAAESAEAEGDTTRAAGIRSDLLIAKMQVAERQRSRSGVSYSRMGPSSVELFGRTGNLPDDDRSLRYR
jgi:hypothetical protein